MADRTYETEFGNGYDIPGFIKFLVKNRYLEDLSWHNDVMPSFGITAVVEGSRNQPEGYSTLEIRFWVNHSLESRREFGKKFMVTYGTSKGVQEDWQYTELENAIGKFVEQVVEHGDEMESVPGIWSLILDDTQWDPAEALGRLIDRWLGR